MKKELNYIAAVEKAVAEKYGKEAVQDFRSQWSEQSEKEYLEQLKDRRLSSRATKGNKERIETNGITIIKKVGNKKTTRTCPLCKTYSFSSKDDLYMNRFECCCRCYIDFVEHREPRWQKGWRPSDEHLFAALSRRKK